MRDESSRHKKNIPALGEWIPLLSVTETYEWRDVAPSYLTEMFDRNVLWTLKKFPKLVEDSEAPDRLQQTYEATIVSNHLCMFHNYFLNHVAHPKGVSLAKIGELLDSRYGKPTFVMKDQLICGCNCSYWCD